MAKFTIGAQEITARLPNFEKLQAAWPYFEQAITSTNPMDRAKAVFHVISIGTMPPEWEDNDAGREAVQVEVKRLRMIAKPDEVLALVAPMNDLLQECGVVKPKGESTPVVAEAAANPSTETSGASSTSSSPPAAAPSETSGSTGA